MLCPTPITPPNVEINKVPSEVTEFNLDCNVSINPNWSFKLFMVLFFIKSSSNCGAFSIRLEP